MTPIKDIIWCDTVVGVRDWVNHVEIQAVALSPEKAKWLAYGLGMAHNVPVIEVDRLPVISLRDGAAASR